MTWVFIFKVLLAAFTALGLAMALDFPAPRTSMVTVFIVMQVQSGQVLAKSFYRAIGTIVGGVVTLVLVGIFSQDTWLLLTSMVLWIGLCSIGAHAHRNFRGYGFLLAGYTTVTIALPLLAQPGGVFMAAVWRVTEILLGIFVSGVVSAAILPQTAQAMTFNTLYQRIGRFFDLVVQRVEHSIDEKVADNLQIRFVLESVTLEGLRFLSVFEDPGARQRSGRIKRLNSEFLGVTTAFHSFYRMIDRAGCEGYQATLRPNLEAAIELIKPYANQSLTPEDAGHIGGALNPLLIELRCRATEHRQQLERQSVARSARQEFDTAFELLEQFLQELHNYLASHASMKYSRHEREQWGHSFVSQTSWVAAFSAGLRSAEVVMLLGAFWLETAWPSGATATLIGASTVMLAAGTSNARLLCFQMGVGTLWGAIVGFAEYFNVLPKIDGFPLLCVALAAPFAFGAFLVSRPKWFGYGVGQLVFFAIGTVPDNMTAYDPAGF